MDLRPPTIPAAAREAVLDVYRVAVDGCGTAILGEAIDVAVAYTDSRFGCIHAVDKVSGRLEPTAWSTGMPSACGARDGSGRTIQTAGPWADAVRTGEPTITNSFGDDPADSAMPGSPMRRHLGVPVVVAGEVRLLFSLGDSSRDYTVADVELVHAIAAHTGTLVTAAEQRAEGADAQRRLAVIESLARICSWEWDPPRGILKADHALAGILGWDPAKPTDVPLRELLRHIRKSQHVIVASALADLRPGAHFCADLDARRTDGYPLALQLRGAAYAGPDGHGVVLRGTIQEVGAASLPEAGHGGSSQDPLTGLANRVALEDWLQEWGSSAHRRSDDALAFHRIDIIGFREINQEFGRPMGDEVLRAVARRLQRITRSEDLVVRLGEDDFLVVQGGAAEGPRAAALAEKVRRELGEPINLSVDSLALRIRVGTVIATEGDRLDELLHFATAALAVG